MARTREFDMDQALDAALSTFWTQGYQATSMTDLMEATGLHKEQSLQGLRGQARSLCEVVGPVPGPVPG